MVRRHRILFDEAAIAARVGELAAVLRRDLPHRAPVLIGLLTGSFVFVADLARALSRLGVEPQIDFMAVSHYGAATTSGGRVEIRKDTALDLDGRVVVLLDDILDSGQTLQLVCAQLTARKPQWFRTCVLLDKPAARLVDIQADYVGFEVPDLWIIGYGLDAGGEGRALPYVAALEAE